MVDVEQLKNPVIIGAVVAAVAYGFLCWKENQRQKKHPNAKKKSVSIVVPGVAGAIAWFVASSCFEDGGPKEAPSAQLIGPAATLRPSLPPQLAPTRTSQVDVNMDNIANMAGGVSKVFPVKSSIDRGDTFHMVGKNSIRIPPDDVFHDLAKF